MMPLLPSVFVAIDKPDFASAKSLISELSSFPVGLKIGLELFCALGLKGLEELSLKQPLFLDLKFHDIPNTVAAALGAVSVCEPAVLNIHTSGGLEMMRRASDSLTESCLKKNLRRPALIGVTVLTSLDLKDIQTESSLSVSDLTLTRAKAAQVSGLNGIVCSAQELDVLRPKLKNDFLYITPGIRPSSYAQKDDQKRTLTPKEALTKGATSLVVGRPITQSPDPAKALGDLLSELS